MSGGSSAFSIAVFALLLGLTGWIHVRASRRVHTTSHFWAAGHSIGGAMNGVAVSGATSSARRPCSARSA